MNKLNSLALGYTGAALSALGMLIMGIVGNLGFYQEAIIDMQNWHLTFSLSPAGILAGMIEAAIFSFIILYVFGLVYNKFASGNE